MAGQIKFSPKFYVSNVADDILVDIDEASEMDYSDFAFGFSISGAVVTLNAGYVWHGARAGLLVTGTTKTITADNQYVWLEYDLGAFTASWAAPSVTLPQPDATVQRKLFYQFRLTGGVASLAAGGLHYIGDVSLPGEMAG